MQRGEYLKKAPKLPERDGADVRATVQSMLSDIEAGGDETARAFAHKLDKYDGDLRLSPDAIKAAEAVLPQQLKDDINYAHDNIRRFAEAQRNTIQDIEVAIADGFVAGQRNIPCETAGCYIPGGRYSHIASALMTVTTAKVAGCDTIIACTPPRAGGGADPAVIYSANLCGADHILAMGGVQGIAAMAFGLFGLPEANMIVGPGNQFVAEAKRMLFGRVGIDMIAGPTDSLVIADSSADPKVVAVDMVGQAEHGYNSPVWLITSDRALGEEVIRIAPHYIDALPEMNRRNAAAAWRDYAEVLLCADREAMAEASDLYAPEHLTVQAADLDWWLSRLRNYGSLFLGEETTVAYGDKAAGPNHVLPTSRASRYSGGLSVHKFMKTVTWQRATREGARAIAETTARISRWEGMEGHARSADIRLNKYFPDPSDRTEDQLSDGPIFAANSRS